MKLPEIFASALPFAAGMPAVLTGGGMGVLLAGLGALVIVFAALAGMAVLCRKHRFSFFWGFLAVVFSGAAMLLCVVSASSKLLIAKPAGDPRETVSGFFDALITQEYDAAYACLSGYSDLGLEGSVADPAGQTMVDALRASYSYTLYGPCTVDKLSAHQEVQFTYLNLASIAKDVEEETARVLNEIVEERARNEIYDEDNNYLPQVTQEAYATAVSRVLQNPRAYYATAGLQLQLEYKDGVWLLIPSENLLKALTGGA